MFWKKKNKSAKKTKTKDPKEMSREELIAQAKANASAAREQIGDETLDKIREAMMKKERSALEQAKNKVKSMEKEKVADQVSSWMRNED